MMARFFARRRRSGWQRRSPLGCGCRSYLRQVPCEAGFGGLTSFDGKQFHTLATRGLSPQLAEVFREPWTPGTGSFHEGLVRGEALMHGDHMTNPALGSGHAQTHGVVELGGARTG